jgi:Asp-tRNA(Asn)/Glu-tRNA(Gln) amidotransferase A subunit family amidase
MPNLLESASNLHAARLRREFSARDLLGATLAAIERLVPAANAIVQNDTASAWRGASDSDTRIARGEARPPNWPPANTIF